MSDKMPESMDEEAVAAWAFTTAMGPESSEKWAATDERTKEDVYRLTRAVLALVEAKVREALSEYQRPTVLGGWSHDQEVNAIVSRVLGRDGGAR